MTIQDVSDRLRDPGTVLLDTILPDNLGRSSFLFCRPERVIRAATGSEVPAALAEADDHVRAGKWVAGYLTYDAGYALEPRFGNPPAGDPLVWLGVYPAPDRLPSETMAAWLDSGSSGEYRISNPRLGVSKEDYLEAVARILGHIREGDVYQVNYTVPLALDFEGDPLGLYGRLRRRQPVPYAAYLRTEAQTILSLSPELFFTRRGERIVTRPMKGTAAAGGHDEEDLRRAAALRDDPKNRAENLMIVDLLRNDLSVCCSPGSVVVSDLFGIERYPTLFQMTSTVEGRLLPNVSYENIFRALFPSGSVTGAPKIRAMELIRDIEVGPRGVYCGAVGFIAPDTRATFNVAIRTVHVSGARATMGTGSGIVWDSEPEGEYEECLLKTRFLVEGPSA